MILFNSAGLVTGLIVAAFVVALSLASFTHQRKTRSEHSPW